MTDNKEKKSLDVVEEKLKSVPGEPEAVEKEVHLGVAGNVARIFISSPLTPMLIILFILMGLAGIVFTPRQEDPQITVPMVDIFVRYPGASAQQVTALVAKPLERIMSEMSGVKHIYAAAQRDSAIVTVQFKVGQKMGPSLTKLYSKLNSNKDKMPPGVTSYIVKPKDINDVPGLTLTLWSNQVNDASLRLVALDVLQKLSEVPNSNQGFVVSGRTEQLRVEVLPEKLAGYGITLQQIANTIRQANSEESVGNIEAWDKSFKVYTGSFLRTAQDVENVVVGIKDGLPVYIRDVANVINGPSEVTKLVTQYTGPASKEKEVANGAQAVTIAIAKKKGSNGVSVYKALLAKVNAIKGVIIPDNVHVFVSRDYGVTANNKVNELIFKLFVATGIVTLLIWYALGWRPAVVVLIVIPIVILFTVFSAMILGQSINRVSLFALIFSIGILVDDAIVVIENIYRHWLIKGDMSEKVSIDAVREVGNPTILATFTVIAALLPMGAVRGMMGPYMLPIPILGTVAMLVSLFAAFAFTPWLANRLKPSMEQLRKSEEKEHRANDRLARFFRRMICPLVDNKKLGYGFLISLFVLFFASCAMFYTKAVSVKMLPLDNKAEFDIVINFPEGTSLIDTANLAATLAGEARKFKNVVALQSYVGTASPYDFNGLVRHYYLRDKPWQADIQVELTDKDKRDVTSHQIVEKMRKVMAPVAKAAGARIQMVEMPPGPPVLQSVVAIIYGPNAKTRRKFAHDMTLMFEKAPSITDVDNLMQDPYEIWRFEVDRDKALREGISFDAINQTLAMAVGGYRLGDIKRGSVVDPTYIVLQVPQSVRSEFSRLGTIPVQAANGALVPLSELGTFVKGIEQDVIYQKDLRNVEFVTGASAGKLAAPIYGMFQVDDMLKNYIAPDGVKVAHGFIHGGYFGPPANSRKSAFEWGGEWTVTYETFRDMGGAFLIAMVLIYMLVVVEFKNYIFASIIMAPIPLTLIGIIPGHWLLNASFTATSMIGWIALSGIIVRNSILLVDFTRHEVLRGIDVRDAVINACRARTRPILITALALVGGSSVILTDPIFQGMAISLLFGVIVSTILTLFIIPLGCISAKNAFAVCPAGSVKATVEEEYIDSLEPPSCEYKTPVWMSVYSAVVSIVNWIFVIVKTFYNLVRLLISVIREKLTSSHATPPTEPGTPGSSSPTPVPPAPPVPSTPAASTDVHSTVKTKTAESDASATASVADLATEKTESTDINQEKIAKPDVNHEVVKKAMVKKAMVKKAMVKKGIVKKETVKKKEGKTVPKKSVVKKKISVKTLPVKKTTGENSPVKKGRPEKVPGRKITVKKVPAKKSPSGKRRGIRLKVDNDQMPDNHKSDNHKSDKDSGE